jgi:hypothetical protein
MTENYGKRVGSAVRAVQQLHQDSSKLLLDLDKAMAGWKSVFGNAATNGLNYSLGAPSYMAEGLFRHYWRKESPNRIRSVNIVFIDYQWRTDEPLLLVADIEYAVEDEARALCEDGWRPWYLYFERNENWARGEVLMFDRPDKEGRIAAARVIAVPLYDISSIEDVTLLSG